MNKTCSIRENDKVLILDGCYTGCVVKVLAVRYHRHFPILVSLPNKEIAEFHFSQVAKVS